METNGIDIHYYRTGNPDGVTLVLAHGLYDDGRCFAPTMAEFTDQFDVIAIDARGHGLSDAPSIGYTIDDRVADLAGLLDELSIDSPILWGHSMVGNTVACLAATYPTLPRTLVLEDPAGMLHGIHERASEERIFNVRELIESWHNQSCTALLESFEHEAWKEYLFHARRRVSTDVTEIFRNGYRRPSTTFSKITCPTLILRADVDDDQRALDRERVDRFDDARLEHVTNAGHCIRRDEFGTTVHLIRQFLSDSVETE
ncbi:alpha/beta fold hydrolase [Haladaptatus caseinilyticus]|uniref:alpha/beta fold hydrolase n=1 Tax=Haladaptatus caseinilyticus TaxID=2993314 RepID=UPI00224B0EAC|nr:alpha/beta hydrolase [Haladaptatus caseinilyticus]